MSPTNGKSSGRKLANRQRSGFSSLLLQLGSTSPLLTRMTAGMRTVREGTFQGPLDLTKYDEVMTTTECIFHAFSDSPWPSDSRSGAASCSLLLLMIFLILFSWALFGYSFRPSLFLVFFNTAWYLQQFAQDSATSYGVDVSFLSFLYPYSLPTTGVYPLRFFSSSPSACC